MSRNLQMVGGASYSHPAIKDGSPVVRGEIVSVDDALADMLEEEFYLDGVDKECPYFVAYTKSAAPSPKVVKAEAKVDDDDDEDDIDEASDVGTVKPVSQRRAARKSK